MGNTTNSLADKSRLRQMIDSYGVPRMIITGFLLLMFVLVPFAGVDFATQISNVINRFSWNAIMVLAMVPMVHSGCGLNFGLPLGIISGLLGATLSIELGFTGPMSFVMAIAIATPFALLLGGGYGWLLNKIKGGEMMVATYVGFSSVSFMCMMWLLLPYKKPEMVWGFSGSGLPCFPNVGIPAHQDRHRDDRRRLQPFLCQGSGRQHRQDAPHFRRPFHLAGRGRHPRL